MIRSIIGSTMAFARTRRRARWLSLALVPALTAMAVAVVPRVRSLSPSYVMAGAGAVQVKVHGEGFTATTVARLGAQTRPTRVVNDKLAQVDLTAADVATARTVSISVATPGTGGGVSNAIPFEIRGPVDTEPPTIVGLPPIEKITTSPAGATVTFPLPSATDNSGPVTVTCTPPSGTVFPLGTTTVTCVARDATGNTASVSFSVRVIETTPPRIVAPADITVTAGDGTGAAVSFGPTVTDNFPDPPTVVCEPPSGTVFPVGVTTVKCTATDLSGNSAWATFRVTVNAPATRITTVAPTAVPIGSAALRITVSGTGFGAGSVVRWNTQPLVTRVVSATVLEADVPAALMAVPAAVRLIVATAAGTASNAIPFAVAELVPSISSVSPTTLTLLQGVNFVVRGRNFTPATRFRWGGSEFEPTMVSVNSATEMIADLRGGYLGQPGTENVSVATRYPSGTVQVSNSVPVTIVFPPGPTITSLTPSSVVAGTGTGLRIRGTNFTSTSEVRLDGSALNAQVIEFVSASELGVYLGGAYFIDRKSIAVTVANKLPTGHVLVSPPATIQVTP